MNTVNNNTGYDNTGYKNAGDCNAGGSNVGDFNTGDSNPGNFNTGDSNPGNFNTGNWNPGSRNTGYFNVDTPDTIRVFGRECSTKEWDDAYKPGWLYFNLTEWVNSNDMTAYEKARHPSHATTGGYLRKYEYKEAFRRSYEKATREEQLAVKNLPNFDADIFFEISGIRIDEDIEELTMEQVCAELGREIKIKK
jgi:hypothetical protein